MHEPSGNNFTSYTVAEAAAALKVAPRTVRDLIAAGELAAFSVGRGTVRPVYRVTDKALTDYATARQVAGKALA